MSRSRFIESLTTNKREANKGAKTFASSIRVIYPNHMIDSGLFDEDKLIADLSKEGVKDGRQTIRTGTTFKKGGGGYTYLWTATPGPNITEGSASNSVVDKSRKHIQLMMIEKERAKRNPIVDGKMKPSQEALVGGHVVASAFLQLIRKGLAIGVLKQPEADRMIEAHAKGQKNIDIVDKDTGKSNEVDIYEDENYFGISYEAIKEINEQTGIKYNIDQEVMIPLTKDTNAKQATNYENEQAKLLQQELTRRANDTSNDSLFEVEGSFSVERMCQEIIAAKLLGKRAPKYKDNQRFVMQKPKIVTKRRKRKLKDPKAAEKRHIRSQLKAAKARELNPTSLLNLLNKKLPQEIQKNMKAPGLQNQTGRFANSIRAIKYIQGKGKMPTIQYTYDIDPYQVFETGGKGDSRWATEARDPRILIDKTIREIVATMMLEKFPTRKMMTQRL